MTLECLSLQSVSLTSEPAFSIIAASASLRKIHFMSEARVPVDERQPESLAHLLPHSQARDRLAAMNPAPTWKEA
jgi:hypothetical protein